MPRNFSRFHGKHSSSLENRNGILWDSISVRSCPTSLSPCSAHTAYFQVTVNVMMRLPRTRKHRVTAPAREGDLERTEHLHLLHSSVFSLPMAYRLAVTVRPRKKNKKKILRTKNDPLLFTPFPFNLG